MSIYAKKLIFAAILSLAGIATSYGWYTFTDKESVGDTSKVVARLDYEKNEVQRRPNKHVIWERVDEGEDLHTGEAIRTASDSEAKIIFKTGAEVDLDPESVVVIEDSGDKVNLDFVKGNLLVKGGNASGDLNLKSGNTNIALNNADLAVGKNGAKGVDVQVLRGSAEVSNGSKKLTLDQSNHGTISDEGMDVSKRFFKDVKPSVNDKVFVKVGEAAHFKWDALSADYDVNLELGATRDSLRTVGPAIAGDKGDIAANLKAGTQFWKLVAVSKKDKKDVHEGTVNKVTVVFDVPPKLLSPVKDSVVSLMSEAQGIDLRWANPSHLNVLKIEVSQEPRFAKPLIAQAVEDTGLYTINLKQDGVYYWRVTGWRTGNNVGLSSDPLKFTLNTHFELTPPDLKIPVADARLPFENINNGGSFFSWQPVPGISQYHLYLEEEKSQAPVFDKEVNDLTQTKIPPLKPGVYLWSVTSLNGEGKASKRSTRKFSVEDVPSLPWADNLQQENYLYVTDKPSLKPTWRSSKAYTRFQVIVKSDDGTPDIVSKTDGVDPTVSVAHDGLYHVVVEAVDANGMAVARTSSRDFFVGARPLLPAPAFADRMPSSVQAQNNGSATFSWKTVNGAKFYDIVVKDGAGKIVKKEKFGSPSGIVHSLLPGNYKVSLAAVDAYGRVGPEGDAKSLVVPDVSDAKAPRVKKIEIH